MQSLLCAVIQQSLVKHRKQKKSSYVKVLTTRSGDHLSKWDMSSGETAAEFFQMSLVRWEPRAKCHLVTLFSIVGKKNQATRTKTKSAFKQNLVRTLVFILKCLPLIWFWKNYKRCRKFKDLSQLHHCLMRFLLILALLLKTYFSTIHKASALECWQGSGCNILFDLTTPTCWWVSEIKNSY